MARPQMCMIHGINRNKIGGLLGLFLLILIPGGSIAQYDPPWFVQDVQTILSNDPEGRELINEFGNVYLEDGHNDGDVTTLDPVGDLDSVHYMGVNGQATAPIFEI